MRDPDLMGRAQRAATELERAWDRWRTIHGLSREPMPAVSSYVGYSLEEPWGQPRVVFGIEAREAEQLAALLDHHDSAGPVYAGMASQPGARPEQAPELMAGAPDRGRIVVPGQAQASMAEREAAWREATWRETAAPEQDREAAPPQPSVWEKAVAETPGGAEPGPRDAERTGDAETGLPGRASFGSQAGPEPAQADDEEDEDAADRQDDASGLASETGLPADAGPAEGWTRPGRGSTGRVLPRTRRAGGGTRGIGGKQPRE